MLVNAEKIFLKPVDRIRRDPASLGNRAGIVRRATHQSRHPIEVEGEFRSGKNGILQ